MRKVIIFATVAFYSEMIFGMIETNNKSLSKRSLSPINFEKNMQDKKMKLSELHVIEDMKNFKHFDPPFMRDDPPFSLQSQNSSPVVDNEEQCSQEQFDRLFHQYIKLDKIDQSREKMQLEAQNWISAQRLKQFYMLDGKNFAEACKFGMYFPNLRKLTINVTDCLNISGNEVFAPMLTDLIVVGEISDEHWFKETSIISSMLKNPLKKLTTDMRNLTYFQADKLNLQDLRELKLTSPVLSKEQLKELNKMETSISNKLKSQLKLTSLFLLNLRLNLKILDLSNIGLICKSKKLLYSVGEMLGLAYLNLSKNKLTTISKHLKNLKNLTHFDLSDNLIKTGIPDWMSSLKNLTHLDLSKNEIASIPVTIEVFQKLTHLNLSYNHISRIPDVLWNLKNLSYLNLSANNIVVISSQIGNVESLNYLNLSGNRITALPSSIKNLKKLTHLDLFGNKEMTYLPRSIINLFNLKYLDIRHTGIILLPISKDEHKLNLNEVYLSNLAYMNTCLYLTKQCRSNVNT